MKMIDPLNDVHAAQVLINLKLSNIQVFKEYCLLKLNTII